MGNSGSSDIILEKEDDKYILTGDGVKLSPALLDSLMKEDDSALQAEDFERLKQKSATTIAEERKKVQEANQVIEQTRDLLAVRENQMTSLATSWKEKLEDEKQKHTDFYNLTMEEFEEAVERTEKKFVKPSLRPVCEVLQDSMISCYRENPKQTLNCSKQVMEFSQCVENAKQNFLNLHGSPGA